MQSCDQGKKFALCTLYLLFACVSHIYMYLLFAMTYRLLCSAAVLALVSKVWYWYLTFQMSLLPGAVHSGFGPCESFFVIIAKQILYFPGKQSTSLPTTFPFTNAPVRNWQSDEEEGKDCERWKWNYNWPLKEGKEGKGKEDEGRGPTDRWAACCFGCTAVHALSPTYPSRGLPSSSPSSCPTSWAPLWNMGWFRIYRVAAKGLTQEIE